MCYLTHTLYLLSYNYSFKTTSNLWCKLFLKISPTFFVPLHYLFSSIFYVGDLLLQLFPARFVTLVWKCLFNMTLPPLHFIREWFRRIFVNIPTQAFRFFSWSARRIRLFICEWLDFHPFTPFVSVLTQAFPILHRVAVLGALSPYAFSSSDEKTWENSAFPPVHSIRDRFDLAFLILVPIPAVGNLSYQASSS